MRQQQKKVWQYGGYFNAIVNYRTSGICNFSLTDIAEQQNLTSTN
jgi:hypothetical protein